VYSFRLRRTIDAPDSPLLQALARCVLKLKRNQKSKEEDDMSELSGKRIVIFVDDIYEDKEFWYPKIRMKEAGAEVVVAGPEAGKTYTGKHGLPAEAEVSFDSLSGAEADALIIPGGYCPDRIRRHQAALDFVKFMDEAGKIVAFICHGGWVPASAGIVKGRRLTSFFAIKDDLVNAGAEWTDEEVVVDKNLITSRNPDDLPAFCKAIIDGLS
jgi:protease I